VNAEEGISPMAAAKLARFKRVRPQAEGSFCKHSLAWSFGEPATCWRVRVRTHKGDSIGGGFVIHGLRRETADESQLFLADRGTVHAAEAAPSDRYKGQAAS